MINVTVDTDGVHGDYPSLNAAIADQAGAGDDLTITCQATEGDADTNSVTISGISHHITIQAASGDRAGRTWSDAIYRLQCTSTNNNGIAIVSDALSVTILGLQIKAQANSTQALIYNTSGTGIDLTVGKCWLYNTYRGACVFDLGGAGGTGSVSVVYDCIAYTTTNRIRYDCSAFVTFSASIMTCYNCLALGNHEHGFDQTYGTVTCYNCISQDAGDTDFGGTGGDYNLSSDTSAPGDNSVTESTLTFADKTGGDYYLDTTDTDAIGAGVADPGSGLYSDDITDTAWGASWDIGPLKYATGGGPTEAAGTSEGSSVVSGVGKTIARASGTASGGSTVLAVGLAIALSVGSAAGSSTAEGAGNTVIKSTGTAAGVSTASGIGESIARSAGTASGMSTATGATSSTSPGDGTASGTAEGTSTAEGVGKTVARATGTATGTSTISGDGITRVRASGTASGTSAVSGAGNAVARSEGASAGTTAVSGTGVSIARSAGTSAGSSTVSGRSTSEVQSVHTFVTKPRAFYFETSEKAYRFTAKKKAYRFTTKP